MNRIIGIAIIANLCCCHCTVYWLVNRLSESHYLLLFLFTKLRLLQPFWSTWAIRFVFQRVHYFCFDIVEILWNSMKISFRNLFRRIKILMPGFITDNQYGKIENSLLLLNEALSEKKLVLKLGLRFNLHKRWPSPASRARLSTSILLRWPASRTSPHNASSHSPLSPSSSHHWPHLLQAILHQLFQMHQGPPPSPSWDSSAQATPSCSQVVREARRQPELELGCSGFVLGRSSVFGVSSEIL